ncbi:glycoside hydrolase family 71/99-like protein [Ferruginibacter albus]|uniref:glycoside hydrolase family 71/99-like protein n=1 Tax=Ferruginibacter albus TaxID=2875540 RepID=UPI001CC57E1A|nr:glycoside hydrolase family 71/99-like protein [Ferruginibacter albus]UAY53303.1 hypothetical protein K9M53_06435 [Ferruginibacter albus]
MRILNVKRFLAVTAASFLSLTAICQVGIGTDSVNKSAILQLESTNKAFLPPRMNTMQRNQIANPAAGMLVYNTDSTCVEMYRGVAGWVNLCSFAAKNSINSPLYSGSVVVYNPVAVAKTSPKKVFAHMMPWFETPATNSGAWGSHWTMGTQNPNTTTNGYQQIASFYYPLTGPYASSDTAIIDYQLLLMKLSGIDGVLIDWYGSSNKNDYPSLERNTSAIVSRTARAGLNFALVYEDATLSNFTDKVAQAKLDMTYAQTNYFSKSNYEKISGAPLLLTFGPQSLTGSSNWTSAFSVLTTQPFFLSYMFNTGAGTAANGQFAWVEQSGTTRLNQFYSSGAAFKMSDAYPGFNSFYSNGNSQFNGGPQWTISANGIATFQSVLSLALQQDNQYIQLTTWNDYGEGTMMEPTDSTTGFMNSQSGLAHPQTAIPGFGYANLINLQNYLGVSSLSQPDLEAVLKLYKLRKTYASDAGKLNQLTQVYYYIVSLQMDKAKALLAQL